MIRRTRSSPPNIPHDDAVNTIQDRLSQGILDWDVSHGDLTDINSTLSELTPSERNEVISQLEADDLKNWAQEIHGTLGSLSAGERQDLFNNLADGLDGEQLTRVVNAFESEGLGDSVRELGTAVATHADAQTKLDFVAAMAERTTAGDSSYDPAPTHKNDVTNTLQADPDAQAVAEVLGSLEGGDFDTAIGSLSDTQLDAVMQAGIYQAETHSRNGTITNFDSAVAARVVEAAATSNDPAVQARVFESAGGRLEVIQGGGENGAVPFEIGTDGRQAPARDELTTAMTQLLHSDTAGVVTQLETAYRQGDGLTAYLTEQLASGREDQVGELLAKVQMGNDLSEDPVARFEATDADGNRQNAQVLGYFMGATEAAIVNVTNDNVAQAQMVGNVFKGVISYAGIAGSSGGPGVSVGTDVANRLTDAIVNDAIAGHREEGGRLHDTLSELAYPREADGTPYEGEQSESAYDAARGRVLDAQGF